MRSAADLLRSASALVAVILVIAAAGAVLPAAAGAATGRVCVSRLAVVDSPRGFTVGYVFRGDRVRITRRTADRRWLRIFTANELRGWVRARSLCR